MKPQSLMLAIAIALGLSAPLYAQERSNHTQNTAEIAFAVTERPRPQDDFYTFINFDYLRDTKLPADKAQVDNMSKLADQAKDTIKALLKKFDDDYAQLPAASDAKNIIDFYRLAIDFETRDDLGFQPIQTYLDAINRVDSVAALNELQREWYLQGYAPFMSLDVGQDQKNSDMNILYVGNPLLGLEKSYIEGEDDYSAQVRNAYQTFLQDVLVLSGERAQEAQRKAALVMALDKELAGAQLDDADKMDQSKLYNEMTLAQLDELTANLQYGEALKALDLAKADKIVVQEPQALEKLNAIYDDAHLEALKAKMALHIISNNALNLNKALIRAASKYYAVYTGIDHVDADEELAYQATNSNFGEMLGKVYVEETFSPQTKADVTAMTNTIRETYARRIQALDWLSEDTKKHALKKLDTLVLKIGYPDHWKSYSGLVIKSYAEGGNLVEAVNAISAIEGKRVLSKINQAPDRSEWQMTPQTVNAYYNPTLNEIVFPAAILQPPFYSPDASRAENLGGIGAIIGHELSHGFDISGSQFDEKGNLNNWWTPEDYEKFQQKVKRAADLYSAVEVAPGHHINGDISTAEIMADLGGLTVVIDIAEKEGIDTRDVFENFARTWRNVSTMEALISGLTDEHPPGKYRINNIVNQLDRFYSDYDVTEQDKMYLAPEKRLSVW